MKRRTPSPLDRHRVPAPPPELEARVAAAASFAARRELERRGWIDRLWESRAARLLWGASAGLLLLANLFSTAAVGPPASLVSAPAGGIRLAAVIDPFATVDPFATGGSAASDSAGQAYRVGVTVRRDDGIAIREWRRQLVALLELEGDPETTTADGRRTELLR